MAPPNKQSNTWDPTNPYETPIPGAPTYEQATLLANASYQKALAALNEKRSSMLRDYGYQGSIDPHTGTITDLRVDPYNAYGSYQTLLRNSATASENAIDAAEGRGIHGGLAHQLESDVQYEHGAQSAQLGRSLTENLADLEQQQEEAAIERNKALYEAQLEQAQLALQNGDHNPAGGDPGDDSGDDGNNGLPTGNNNFNASAISAAEKAAGQRRAQLLRRLLANNNGSMHIKPI